MIPVVAPAGSAAMPDIAALPLATVRVAFSTDTPVASIGSFTVRIQVAFLLEPSFVLAVILTIPGATPSTRPEELTVASVLSDEDHFTFFTEAFFGVT